MIPEIKTIRLGFVNCYLLKTGSDFILIDTGLANQRRTLERELENAGCRPGDLKLIVVTHGDSDHCGNCAYLREKFNAKIAMHKSEAELIESGNILSSRKTRRKLLAKIFIQMIKPLFALKEADKFKADIFVQDGYFLSAWGLDAKILHIPGHSIGSIGVLTANGDLFCGDLIGNYGKPRLHITDDKEAAKSSIEKLKKAGIKTVYPGHGKAFLMEEFVVK
jgi:hydroxyacylglutathione hydrolase